MSDNPDQAMRREDPSSPIFERTTKFFSFYEADV